MSCFDSFPGCLLRHHGDPGDCITKVERFTCHDEPDVPPAQVRIRAPRLLDQGNTDGLRPALLDQLFASRRCVSCAHHVHKMPDADDSRAKEQGAGSETSHRVERRLVRKEEKSGLGGRRRRRGLCTRRRRLHRRGRQWEAPKTGLLPLSSPLMKAFWSAVSLSPSIGISSLAIFWYKRLLFRGARDDSSAAHDRLV